MRQAGAAVLKGYKLEFCKRGKDGTGKATVVLTSSMQQEVPGGLYKVTQEELTALDQHEPDYQRFEVRVAVTGEVRDRAALTYVATPGSRDPDLKPSADYLLLVIRGAIHWGLPESHVRSLGRSAARYSRR